MQPDSKACMLSHYAVQPSPGARGVVSQGWWCPPDAVLKEVLGGAGIWTHHHVLSPVRSMNLPPWSLITCAEYNTQRRAQAYDIATLPIS